MITQIIIYPFKDLHISRNVYQAQTFKNPIMIQDYKGIDSNTPISNTINNHVINKWNATPNLKYRIENVIDSILIKTFKWDFNISGNQDYRN